MVLLLDHGVNRYPNERPVARFEFPIPRAFTRFSLRDPSGSCLGLRRVFGIYPTAAASFAVLLFSISLSLPSWGLLELVGIKL